MIWEPFTRRTNAPKLNVILACLDFLEIKWEHNGRSFHGPIVKVPEDGGQFDRAWELLVCKLGAPSVALTNVLGDDGLTELLERYGEDCTFDDVPDDDEVFAMFGEEERWYVDE